jgi:hypothetical protein
MPAVTNTVRISEHRLLRELLRFRRLWSWWRVSGSRRIAMISLIVKLAIWEGIRNKMNIIILIKYLKPQLSRSPPQQMKNILY